MLSAGKTCKNWALKFAARHAQHAELADKPKVA